MVLFPDLNNRQPQHFQKPKDVLIIAGKTVRDEEEKQTLGFLGHFSALPWPMGRGDTVRKNCHPKPLML